MQNVLYYKRICRQNGTCSCNRYPKLEGKYPLHIKLLAPIPFLLFQQFDALYVLKIKELQHKVMDTMTIFLFCDELKDLKLYTFFICNCLSLPPPHYIIIIHWVTIRF